ncbi:aquaporin Z [Aeromicrobium sp.]|uniref:aquaporin Z n=1 Tax=Aeromicrobium sp. TaxID=1871063 RepID=UPI003D6AB7A6
MSESTVTESTMTARLGAEAMGTFWLVLGGCGTAVLAGEDVEILGVALAFGLTVLTGAYAFGHVSGGHFNPAVSVGLATAGRFSWRDVPWYAAAQVVGATVAATVLFVIASGRSGFDAQASGFASNGYAERSPGGYSLLAVLITEIVLTAFFLFVILGASAKRAAVGFSGLAIGLALTLIHLISIPVSNTSVNPARSLGVAWFAGPDALVQVWAFILAPLIGAAIAGISHAFIVGEPD